jgi:hypothetical protein
VRRAKSEHESVGEKLWKSRSAEIPQKARDFHFSHSFSNNLEHSLVFLGLNTNAIVAEDGTGS